MQALVKGEPPKPVHGKPLSVPYMHRRYVVPTADYGTQFNQHIEPAGQYLSYHEPSWGTPPATGDKSTLCHHEYGTIHFEKPWVYQLGPGESPLAWKEALSKAYKGKAKKTLSRALIKDGYDGVVVLDEPKHGGVAEMVNLGARKDVTHPMPPEARVLRKGEDPPKPRLPAKRARKPPEDDAGPNLAVIHNLSAENLQHAHELGGGLPAPSLAVVNKDHGMDNFGEITLVAHHSMIDPAHTPVFNSDVYSPRWPRAKYRVNEKPLKQFISWLRPYGNRIGETSGAFYTLDDHIRDYGHKEGTFRDYDIKNALALAFLEEKGHKIEPVTRQKRLRHEWSTEPGMREFFDKQGRDHQFEYGSEYHQKLSEAARGSIKSYFERHAAEDPELAQDLINTNVDAHFDEKTGLFSFGGSGALFDDHKNLDQTEVDPGAMRDRIEEAVKPYQHEFEQWAYAKAKPIEGAPYIWKSSTRKIPYTLDNIFKELTHRIRDGENFKFGLGSARSQGAKRFKSIAGIQKDRDKIISKDDFEVAKKANEERFFNIAEKLAAYHPAWSEGKKFGQFDELASIIGDSFKKGKYLYSELKASGYQNVPPELQQELAQFARDLVHLPTEYFEAKPQRIVDLSEFRGAVVPHDVKPETLEVLRHHGIQHIESYDKSGADAPQQRAKALAKLAHAHDLLLSEEDFGFQPLQKASGPVRIALVTAYDHEGKLLLGRRNDNERWTLPGGHLEEGEDPRDGAIRELAEETGLKAVSLSPVAVHQLPSGAILHCFSAYVNGEPHGKNDPDQECEEWRFVDISEGLPKRIANKLAGPQDVDHNLLLRLFHVEELSKVQSPFTFPGLGISDDRREVPIIDTDNEMASKTRAQVAAGARHAQQMDEPGTAKDIRASWPGGGANVGAVSTIPGARTGYAMSNEMRERLFPERNPTVHDHPKAAIATVQHENLHMMFNRVREKYGFKHADTLAQHLVESLPDSVRGHVMSLAYHRNLSQKQPVFHEEAIAGLLNYLNNPGYRYNFHQSQREYQVGYNERFADGMIKQAYQRIRRNAAAMTPELLEQLHQKRVAADNAYEQQRRLARQTAWVQKVEEPLDKNDTPEFQQWFAGSHVRTPDGAPLRVYHGTSKDKDFHTFKIGHRGAWFTSDPAEASSYATTNDSQNFKSDHATGKYTATNTTARVLPVHLSIRNPYRMSTQEFQAMDTPTGYAHSQRKRFSEIQALGHDGVIIGDNKAFVVFQPHQIKSVFNKRPTVAGNISKAEDEISRLLQHPEPAERTMALKLAGLQPEHLELAAQDRDPDVHLSAIHHPRLSHDSAMRLLQAEIPPEQKLPLLERQDLARPEHLRALYEAHANDPRVHGLLVGHPVLDEDLARTLHNDPGLSFEHREALMQHPDTPEDVHREVIDAALKVPGGHLGLVKQSLVHRNAPIDQIEHLVSAAVGSNRPDLHEMARHVLQERILRPALIHQVLGKAKVHPDQAHADLRVSAVSGPGAQEGHLDELLRDRNPNLHAAVAQIPSLQSRHIDSVLESLLATQPRNDNALRMLMAHPSWGYHHLNRLLQPMQKSEPDNLWDPTTAVDASVVQDMLGFQPALTAAFQAARFLSGAAEIPFERMRRAIWEHDEDLEAAALAAYGFDVTDDNRKAMRAVGQMSAVQKAEPLTPTAQDVHAPVAVGDDVARAVARAYADQFVFPVKLGGKHSAGSLLARDEEKRETWLLKPGSGGDSPAAGAAQDPSSQSAREAAWYHVAQDWHLDRWFPRAELVTIDGREYAAMRLLAWKFKTVEKRREKDPGVGRRVLQPLLVNGTLHRWAILDYVLGNPDRHGQNVMVDDDGEVRLIDHGSAFAGRAFDPANDNDSFVPYYLRAWSPEQFNALPPSEKLRNMPRVNEQIAGELRSWLAGLSQERLIVTLRLYGIDPGPSIERLAQVRELAAQLPPDEAINRLWVTT